MQTQINVGDSVRIHLIGAIGKVTDIIDNKLFVVYTNGKYHECMRDWIEKVPDL